jgi:DNA segregation ATPase FtsK/SpoIIIE, S-DNA-T family
MAKKTAKKKSSGKRKNPVVSAIKSIIRFFKDERFRVSLGVFFIAFALLLCLSFTSYMFTWQSDQSLLDMHSSALFGKESHNVENWVGKLGAVLSNKFIRDWFGIASFSFIVIFLLIGFQLLNIRFVKTGRTVFVLLLTTIWASVLFAFLFRDKWFMVGGAHGYYIFQYLQALTGAAGTAAIIILSGFVILIYSFKNALTMIKNRIQGIKNMKPEDLEEKGEDSFNSGEEGLDNNDDELDHNMDEDTQENDTEENHGQTIDLPIANTDYIENEKDYEDAEDGGFSLSVEESLDEEQLSDEEINSDFLQDYDPTLDLEHYKMPTLDLLADIPARKIEIAKEELSANSNRIVKTLQDYKIEISSISAKIGPTVTLYEIIPAPGVRISKIKNLEDDIALSLAALGIRIIAPIPGKGTIGIEVPNSKPEIVPMKSVIKSARFQESQFELPIALGKNISNETYVFNLAKTPHLLVAGATGQGKSVGINAIITSLLYKKHPSQLKFVLIDPKMVELSLYSKIENHFLAKLPGEDSAIITDVKKVVPVLNSLCVEMENRYALLTKAKVRQVSEYNAKFIQRKLNPNNGHHYMPYIVVIIDEFADIIVQEGKEVEVPISRLAAKARAIGIHLIVATQRPSTDVITGVIKANFPSRIAFKVTNGHDSKTIIDTTGANQLIGKGDLLISDNGKIARVQCAFIDTPEVDRITDFISEQQSYPAPMELPEPEVAEGSGGGGYDSDEKDELFEEAARIIVRHQQGSTSLIQRKMKIGYNRAGRIIDQLEASGIVGPYEGSKARNVCYPDEYSLEQYLNNMNNDNNNL